MHLLKKTFNTLTTHDKAVEDEKFVAAVETFHRLTDLTNKCKSNVVTYISHVKGVLVFSTSASTSFADVIVDTDNHNNNDSYAQEALSNKQTHLSALSESALSVIVNQLDSNCLKKLTELINEHNQLNEKIAERTKFKEEADYYKSKVDKLRSEREKRSAAGKTEKQSDIEQYDRNNEKLTNVQACFNAANDTLIAELNQRWANRSMTYGQIMKSFQDAEQQFVNLYSSAVNNKYAMVTQ